VNIDECLSIKSFNAFPKNVVHISYRKSKVDHNMKIPNHIESVNIKFSGWGPNETLTLSKNCKSLILDDSTGKVIFPSVARCQMESRMETDGSKFEFKINESEKQKSCM
ncbi:putative LRR containing protein, partial [Trachipleistophora hominis]